jgi:hypothetical protein
VKVTWRQLARWRFRRQLLVEPAPDALAVARRVCGLHAQVASCTHLIAGIRSATTPDLDTALWRDRSLIRTWAMRGTLHLLPVDELDLWVGARTDYESRRRFPPSWEREHGVTGAQLHAITDAIGEVLGAEPLSRAELAAAIGAHLGDPAIVAPLSTGWGALLKPAAARGLLCSGPATDGAVSFVSPAAWLGRPVRPVDAAAANREVLLPGFDPWVITPLSHRAWSIPPGRTAEVSRTAGWISPVLVVDGAVTGVWEHERRNGEVAITVRPFAPLPASIRDAAEAHAARYSTLLDAAVRVDWR